MVYHYDNTRPEEVTSVIRLGQKICTVNFDITELPEDDPSGYRYSWRSVTLEPGIWNYASLVSAIVYLEYSTSQIEALNANFLSSWLSDDIFALTNKPAEYKEEFKTFTEWRLHAKKVARDIINRYPNP